MIVFVHAVDTFQQLLMLEAKFGSPPEHTAAIEDIVDYYKKVVKIIE